MSEDNLPDSAAAQPRGNAADLGVMLAAHRAFRRDVTTLEWLGIMASLQPAPDLSELVPWLVDGLPANDAADVLAMFPPALAQRYRGEWKPWYDAVSRW